ncbi:MAG: hypothetical protein IT439_02445 [Phycisphaerales bacterium]|nr:hypothetical protein [Phycisphaerales bacterium]
MTSSPINPTPLSEEHSRELARFPRVLRSLVEAELAAGNAIAEIVRGFPAAPCGACVRLARRVTTRARRSTGEIDFCERHSSDRSGEFTDAARHFFVLEAPATEVDSDAGSGAGSGEESTRDAASVLSQARAADSRSRADEHAESASVGMPFSPSGLVERFRAGMAMNVDRWRDGAGFDLSLLRSATIRERAQLEQMLLAAPITDWRVVEALAAIDSPRAREALVGAMARSNTAQAVVLLFHAPELFNESRRTEVLVSALGEAGIFSGLTKTLLLVERHHPPPVIDALLRGARDRDGPVAGQLAAMLLFLHGKADEPCDMGQHGFLRRFNTDDPASRARAFSELCERIGRGASPP